MSYTIAFTGSRPKDLFGYGPEHDASYDALARRIEATIRTLSAAHPGATVVTGGAQGADQLAFAAAEAARTSGADVASIQVFVPFEGQDSYWQEDGRFGRAAYRAMLGRADEVVDCSRGTAGGSAGDGGKRPLYKVRDQAMVNAADVVVAVTTHAFDTRGSSGTAATIRMAEAAGKPVVRVYAD